MNSAIEQSLLQEPEQFLDQEAKSIVPKEPLNAIALCLSGGGFRAASFSLGVLSYLHRAQYKEKRVLDHVKFITSTSGGSIANGCYSVSAYRNRPFTVFYHDLRDGMSGEKLLNTVFQILGDHDEWKEFGKTNHNGKEFTIKKDRNLINAFSKSYDKLFFENATLQTITDCPHELPHLEETAFNTTEFNNGLAYYYKANGHEHYVRYIGNGYLRFRDMDTIKKLKIADIVAASSCFPGGFEPIRYPLDFVYEGNTDLVQMLEALSYHNNDPTRIQEVKEKPFSIMDGGIVDNMGLNCVIDADRIREKTQGNFDLILSCDVTSYFNEALKSDDKPVKGWYKSLTIKSIINIFKFSNLVLLLSLASIYLSIVPLVGYLLLIPSILLSLIYWIGYFKIRSLKKNTDGTAAIAFRYIGYFGKLPFKDLLPMIRARIASVSQLVGSLFLKQIRRVQYEILFSLPNMKDRAIACLVYEFSTAFQTLRLKNLLTRDRAWWPEMEHILMPSEKMTAVANEAKAMGTTLWFGPGEVRSRDKLIATGQLTGCYSLIKHICRLEVLDPAYKSNKALQELKMNLLKDWDLFKKDPEFMLDDLVKDSPFKMN